MLEIFYFPPKKVSETYGYKISERFLKDLGQLNKKQTSSPSDVTSTLLLRAT